MIDLSVEDTVARGYLALPSSGGGPGVLVLHAWWGLTPFFRGVCDRLAEEGFVALAPDLHGGRTAETVEEAERLMATGDHERTEKTAIAALERLRSHDAVRGGSLGVVGFSMGAAWALTLSALRPDDVAAAVLFYGTDEVDFTEARAAYQGHYAERDEWEPNEGVRQVEAGMRAAGRAVEFHTYPGAGHWFFEDDRPEHYDPDAAHLAWERTVRFLRSRLAG